MSIKLINMVNEMITEANTGMKSSQSLANKFSKDKSELSVLADEAAWGIMYHQQSLTRILQVLEDNNETPQNHKQEKPKVRGRTRLGNR